MNSESTWVLPVMWHKESSNHSVHPLPPLSLWIKKKEVGCNPESLTVWPTVARSLQSRTQRAASTIPLSHEIFMHKHTCREWAGLYGMPGIYKDRHLLSFWLKATYPFWFLSSLVLTFKVQNEIKETCFKYKQIHLFRYWNNGPRYRLQVSYQAVTVVSALAFDSCSALTLKSQPLSLWYLSAQPFLLLS